MRIDIVHVVENAGGRQILPPTKALSDLVECEKVSLGTHNLEKGSKVGRAGQRLCRQSAKSFAWSQCVQTGFGLRYHQLKWERFRTETGRTILQLQRIE